MDIVCFPYYGFKHDYGGGCLGFQPNSKTDLYIPVEEAKTFQVKQRFLEITYREPF